MTLDDIRIYRMTHIDNIPHILRNGITHRNSRHRNRNFVSIGDTSLIDYRSTKKVRVDNGDLIGYGGAVITLGDFIPFYFGVKMPMLYVIRHGGNFVKRATQPKDIIYLVCSLKKIIRSGINFYFSDGHATDSMTSFYDNEEAERIPDIIDWKAIKANYWGDDLVLKRKKQAELLIEGDLPVEHIVRMGCYNDAARERLIEMNFEPTKIKVARDAYF